MADLGEDLTHAPAHASPEIRAPRFAGCYIRRRAGLRQRDSFGPMLPDHLMRHVENVPVIIHSTRIKLPRRRAMMLIRGKEKPAMAAEVETRFWSMDDVIALIDAPKLAMAICR